MIFDDFKNLDLYNIDPEIKDFIMNLDSSVHAGKHIINDYSYVNIDEYKTRDFIKLEAHREYIDIQFLLEGEELVYTTDKSGLEVDIEYDENKDIAFYKTPHKKLNKSYLTKNKFIVLYPDDAHSPCTNYDTESKDVKKAIVKIKIKR